MEKQNDKGLYNRYIVAKTSGKPVDKDARYFIMRYDDKGSDPIHLNACREAILLYAELIKDHLPQLSIDLKDEIKNYSK